MLLTTTPTVEHRSISAYLGVVTTDAILGTTPTRDWWAGLVDRLGGRARGYERTYAKARGAAMQQLQKQATQLGADAVVAVAFQYVAIDKLLMVSASGTAVQLQPRT